jgi:hypothetical protein
LNKRTETKFSVAPMLSVVREVLQRRTSRLAQRRFSARLAPFAALIGIITIACSNSDSGGKQGRATKAL